MTYLSVTRGDDRELTVTATDSMEGADLVFTARHRPYSAIVIQKSTDANEIVVGADPFTEATITLDAADTADLDPDVLYWDLQLVDSTDKTHTLATGRLAINPDVTYGS